MSKMMKRMTLVAAALAVLTTGAVAMAHSFEAAHAPTINMSCSASTNPCTTQSNVKQTLTFSGTVTDSEDFCKFGIELKLYRGDTVIGTTTTNGSGIYEFAAVDQNKNQSYTYQAKFAGRVENEHGVHSHTCLVASSNSITVNTN